MKPVVLPADWCVEPLHKSHARELFNCGQAALNRYLQQQARQDAQNQIAAVFVAVAPPALQVLGYYSLSALSIPVAELPSDLAQKLPRSPLLPVTLLGRLAIDQHCQGQGLGQFLLLDALAKSLQAAASIAAMAVVVDAKDGAAAAFYQHYGFVPLNTSAGKFFLPMKTIATLFA